MKSKEIVDIVPYEEGMEDGYASYEVFSNKLIGFFEKDKPVPRANNKPAIRTESGWQEVEKGMFIVTTVSGHRYIINQHVLDVAVAFTKTKDSES